MNSINIQLEPVTFKTRNFTKCGEGRIAMLKNKDGKYYVLNITKDIADASGFVTNDRADLLAMKDGSMFQIVASSAGLITFKKTCKNSGGIRINSQPMCAEILARVMNGYHKEISVFKARVPEPGVINFYPEE